MVRKRRDKQPGELTQVELEIMNILWTLGEGSVRAVMAALPAERDLAYTSVSTMLRILEQKGVVATRKEAAGHVYVPQLVRDDYAAASVKKLVSDVFAGEHTTLVARLISDETLAREDLLRMRRLLDERLADEEGER
jgi:predicted transcriptional regulator